MEDQLCEAILECWPECSFAAKMIERVDKGLSLTRGQYEALVRIWDRIPDRNKAEAGYEEGSWE